MKLKRFSFISILTIVSSVSYSQDEIVKKDGSIILSKILEVSSSQVKYHKYSNPDGPIYTINTSKIEVINFENGDKEDFGKNRNDSGVNTYYKEFKGWNALFVQYNPSSFNNDGHSSSFSGLTLGYGHHFNIVPNQPIYLETGLAVQYSFNTKLVPPTDDKDVINGYKELSNPWFLSLKIPVNITYKYSFPRSIFSIEPFAGFALRGNIVGFVKAEYTIKAKNIASGYDNSWMKDDNWFLFSKKDMGEDYAWKVFQLGWQAGVNFYIGETFYINASYGSDFNEIFKNAKIQTISIGGGYIF